MGISLILLSESPRNRRGITEESLRPRSLGNIQRLNSAVGILLEALSSEPADSPFSGPSKITQNRLMALSTLLEYMSRLHNVSISQSHRSQSTTVERSKSCGDVLSLLIFSKTSSFESFHVSEVRKGTQTLSQYAVHDLNGCGRIAPSSREHRSTNNQTNSRLIKSFVVSSSPFGRWMQISYSKLRRSASGSFTKWTLFCIFFDLCSKFS